VGTYSHQWEIQLDIHSQEGKTNRIELKEDPVEAVEKMISFFYTFDYDDTVTMEDPPLLQSGRPANHMQMNAWVFSIADKYEVVHLKALALEKFKSHADVTDAQQMLGAAWTVFNDMRLPDTEQELCAAVYDMWLLGGADLASNVGCEAMTTYMGLLPDFMGAVFMRLMGGLKDGIVRQVCKKCNRY
jgi:hypothetical protein